MEHDSYVLSIIDADHDGPGPTQSSEYRRESRLHCRSPSNSGVGLPLFETRNLSGWGCQSSAGGTDAPERKCSGKVRDPRSEFDQAIGSGSDRAGDCICDSHERSISGLCPLVTLAPDHADAAQFVLLP